MRAGPTAGSLAEQIVGHHGNKRNRDEEVVAVGSALTEHSTHIYNSTLVALFAPFVGNQTMARLARAELFDPSEVAVIHVMNRVVRRCFLFGDDPVTRKNYDHRKAWIEVRLQQLAAAMGIDLLCFAVLSNHFHLVLRSRPDVVATWDDTEVARRWLMLCPTRRLPNGSPAPATETDLNRIRNCASQCQKIRRRLSDISWWMRLLCQSVAQRANKEDGEQGNFFQSRYRAVRLLDEESLLACAAYVDLNPIRAAISETLESSEHTSIKQRIAQMTHNDSKVGSGMAQALSPVCLDEQNSAPGPQPCASGHRCSDKGFLAITLSDYVELLDWTARQLAPGKGGTTPASAPPIFARLNIQNAVWCELVSDFGRLFSTVAGQPHRIDEHRSRSGRHRHRLGKRVRQLLA